ncbi:conserved exported hypothetical protein [Paraburkholderia unamae]|uniref:hypothetical protein n=1 Tax=Paraburkholderia unamae TaxID=219649 RepID=UPI001CB22B8E|nr:hypothetical protein [Paraburkholderia unamae]CAG9274876.1 conserved exported hypothetical protein [Paraburkholderia unamae]
MATIGILRAGTPRALRATVCLLAAGLPASTGFALDAGPVALPQSAPHYRVGDNWTFLRSDALSGKGRTFTQTVTAVHTDGSASLLIGPGGGRLELTSEANVVPSGAGQQACGIALHFPLQAGTHYEADCRAVSESGMTVTRRAQCDVEGVETVQTKAGSFPAIKIRMSGTWSPQSGYGGGPMEETLWYAPSVKRVVREEFQGRLAGKGVPATAAVELVRYAVKP